MKGKNVSKLVRHKLNKDKTDMPCFNNKIQKAIGARKNEN